MSQFSWLAHKLPVTPIPKKSGPVILAKGMAMKRLNSAHLGNEF